MIKDKKEMPAEISIDLTGPEGNAFVLMGYAKQWAKQIGIDADKILEDMMSGDYENLVKVFDAKFGSFCTLYR